MKHSPLVQSLQRGLAAHQAGRLAEARVAYQAALKVAPDNPDALHLLGVVLGAEGATDRGIELISRAVRLQPGQPDFLFNLGNLYLQQPDYPKAVANYRSALARNPGMADAWENLGIALDAQGDQAGAREAWKRSLSLNPSRAEPWLKLAESFRSQGLLREAGEICRTAASQIPGNAALTCALGNILHQQSRFREAADTFRQAITFAPDRHEVWNNLGISLQKLGEPAESAAAFEQAIRIRPDYVDAYSNLAPVLQQLGRADQALDACRQALALDPAHSSAHNNLASALLRLNRIDEAIAACEHAVALHPDDTKAHGNLGAALMDANRLDEAIAALSRARELDPSNATARKTEGMARLRKGDLPAGFELYEARWEEPEFRDGLRDFGRPAWRGSPPLAGRSLLLHVEQGLGDTIQFARYVPLLAQQGARVFLEAPPALFDLLSDLPGQAVVFRRGEPLPATDFQSPLLSLPLALKTDLGSIPAGVPYLRARPEWAARWQAEAAGLPGLKVGVVWSGNPNHKNDHNRSIPFSLFQSLLSCKGAGFTVLQNTIRTDELPLVDGCPALRNRASALKDFSDTAGLIEHLDLVISVDTSVAHLAGAMGKPTWLLLPFAPDWRWMLNTDRSPWYPTMRLFRQPRSGDWETVLARVSSELESLAAARQAPSC